MKTKIAWILLIVVVLFITCTLAGASETVLYGYYGYSYDRNQARWSIYEHKLVSGDLYYSPYAFKYGQSGLIPENVRYSMYAFSYNNNGLVYRDTGEPYCKERRQGQSYISAPVVVVIQQGSDIDSVLKQEAEKQKRYRENIEARRRRVEQRKKEREAAARVAARVD